jgi:ribosomal protein RSM22 (predicted rRNA methylase)
VTNPVDSLDTILASLSENYSRDDLKAAYIRLSEAYRSGSRISLDTPILQASYCMARMPATVAVLEKVMDYLPSDLKTLLDFGSGPGSVLWAASRYLGLEDTVCVDQSKGLLQIGAQLMEQAGLPTRVDWIHGSILQYSPSHSFDLVSMSYVLNELSASDRTTMLSKAWSATSRCLLLVEPGTPTGFMNIRTAREWLIRNGAQIVAPCTHENTCPMPEKDWCHFSVRLSRSRVHRELKGSLNYEDEKFSYLIASKIPTERSEYRIVKRPLESTGLVELDLCGLSGLTRVKVARREKNLYRQAKKVIWGDGWPRPSHEPLEK